MSDIVDELARVLRNEDIDVEPGVPLYRGYAQAVLDSGLVVSKARLKADVEYWRTIADARYEDRKVSLEKAYADYDEARAEVDRLNAELAKRDAKITEARRLIRDFAEYLAKRGWPVAKHGREMLRRLDGGAR